MAPAQGAQLFVPSPQRRGAIQDPNPLALRQLQEMGGVQVRLINRWVLAHPHQRKAAEGKPARLIRFKPLVREVPTAGRRPDLSKANRLGLHQGVLALHGELGWRTDPDLLTGALGRLHQGDAGVFGWTQSCDRIDHKQLRGQTASESAQAQAPSRASSWPLRSRA